MRHFRFVLPLLLILATGVEARVVPGLSPDVPKWGVVPGRITVKLKPDVEPAVSRTARGALASGLSVLDQVATDVRATRFDPVFPNEIKPQPGSLLHDLTRFYTLEFDVIRDPALVAEAVAADPAVELAEVVTWHAVDAFLPNDPAFDDQWHLMEGPQPTQDNDIDAPEAWEIQTGDPDVVIAIFDTGVLWFHPDLRDQIWVNPGEDLDGDGVVYDVDDQNGVDDDGNGFIDDLIGWDFVAAGTGCASPQGEDCTVADNDPRDFDGHGTHVAGISAAASNNVRNGAGVAGGRYPLQRGCLIMPCRVGWATPDGLGAVPTDLVGQAVNYAVANGARVGNLSAGASSSAVLAAALTNAFANGFIFTKSAGNDNQNFPDAFDDYQTTIAVASTNANDQKSSFSDYGVWVDISAPGSTIWSTYGAGGVASFEALSGTSMAAPVVAGCAALIMANNPFMTKSEVEATLFATADDISGFNPGYEFFLGAGRVNIGNAILSLPQAAFGGAMAQPARSLRTPGAASLAPDTPLVGHMPMTVDFADLSPGTPTAWSWDFGDGETSTEQNPQHVYETPGIFDVTLDATHAEGIGRKRHQSAVLAHADSAAYVNGKNCAGRKAVVELHVTNAVDLYTLTLPLTYQGPGDMVLDSFNFAGTRVEYFEELDRPFSSASNKFSVFTLAANDGGGSPPLPPGSGPVLRLYFTLGPTATAGLSPVDTFTVLNFSLRATTERGITYVPAWEVGGVDVLEYCRGDFDLSGAATSSDIILMVNYVFKSGPASPDPWTMDPNADGSVSASDIIYLVNFVFKGGDPPE